MSIQDDRIFSRISPNELLDSDLTPDPADLQTTPIDLHKRGDNEITRPVAMIPAREKTQVVDASSLVAKMMDVPEPVGDPDATLLPDYAFEAAAQSTDLDDHKIVDDTDVLSNAVVVVTAGAILAALHSEDEPDTQVNQVIPPLPVAPPPAPSEPPRISTPPVLGDAVNAAKRPKDRNPEPGPAISGERRTKNENGAKRPQRPLTQVFDPPTVSTQEPQVATLKGNADIKTAEIKTPSPPTSEAQNVIDSLWEDDVDPAVLERMSRVTQPTLKVTALSKKDVTKHLMAGAVDTSKKLSFTEKHGVGMTIAVLLATLLFVATVFVTVYMSSIWQTNNQNQTAVLMSDASITESVDAASKTILQAVLDASYESDIQMYKISEEFDTNPTKVVVDQVPIPPPVIVVDHPPAPTTVDDSQIIIEETPPVVLQTPIKTRVLTDCKPVVGLKVDKDSNIVIGQKTHDGKPVLMCDSQKYVANDVQCDNAGKCTSGDLLLLDDK